VLPPVFPKRDDLADAGEGEADGGLPERASAQLGDVQRVGPSVEVGAAVAEQLELRACQNDVRYRSQQGAAVSTIYFFALDNRSARACSVFGYVGVAAFNSQGASEPLVLQRDSSKPSRTVLLRPGASSFFQLQAGNPTSQSAAASCERATTLHVTPPDERAYIAIEAHDFTSCGNHTVTTGAVQGQ